MALIDFDTFAPVILKLIDEAEDRLDDGPSRHRWVVDEAMKIVPMPRYVPKPVRRVVTAWLVEVIFQLAVKGLGILAERIAKRADLPDAPTRLDPEPESEPVKAAPIEKPKKIARQAASAARKAKRQAAKRTEPATD